MPKPRGVFENTHADRASKAAAALFAAKSALLSAGGRAAYRRILTRGARRRLKRARGWDSGGERLTLSKGRLSRPGVVKSVIIRRFHL